MVTLRDRVMTALRAAGAGRGLLGVRYVARLVIHPGFRRLELKLLRDYLKWRRLYRAALQPPLYPPGSTKRALIVIKGTLKGAQVEIGLIKGIELGGFVPVVLTNRSDLKKHFRLAGVRDFIRWDQFRQPVPQAEAEAIVAKAHGIDDLLNLEHAGARVGKFALSTAFRTLRVGRLDFSLPLTRQTLAAHLASGMARADVSQRLIDTVKPDLALFMGNRYTGQGELMDVCVARGIDVLTWFDAHRSSSLMLKRYRLENRDQHHGSISDETWAGLRRLAWTSARQEELRRELHDNYAAGDWYSRGGTQVNKSIVGTEALRRRLGLDPLKKTGVIFPHIVWDATLFWGTDLFNNYEDWLVETVRSACTNSRVNWIIKIHPAHVSKNAAEGYDDEPAEIVALRRRVGPLPPHVKVIPPDTDINTFSLFGLMDYCLTVRGTIGIEAACLGRRVLTAGTGRYDHHGFTTDSDSREEYLARVAAIETLPPLSPVERELAERFAYGALVLRPLPLTTLTIEHARNLEATMTVRVNARSSAALRQAPDMVALGDWAADGRQEDFLWSAPLHSTFNLARAGTTTVFPL
ncbi:MAG: hypothetical protein ABI665_00280 [Vicinamibacterales bacterium]